MNKFLFLVITFISTVQWGFCAIEATSPELSQSLKTHSNEPGIMSIAFALLFVICLIYGTGILYQKLNIVGAKTVKEQLKNHDMNSVVVLSTTQLGQGKNLHVIEINNQQLLIGATPSSISLIKELSSIGGSTREEVQKVREIQSETEVEKDFDIHKKYL